MVDQIWAEGMIVGEILLLLERSKLTMESCWPKLVMKLAEKGDRKWKIGGVAASVRELPIAAVNRRRKQRRGVMDWKVMGRAKLNLELISKEKSRNTTFQKRKKGLKKKSYEFSTLCDVDACLIIFGPKHGDRPLEIWPENSNEVLRIINRYKDHSKEEREKRNLNLSNFFEDRKKKVEEELSKLRQKNNEINYSLQTWDDDMNIFTEDQLIFSLDCKLEYLKTKIGSMKGKQAPMMNGVEYYTQFNGGSSSNHYYYPALEGSVYHNSPFGTFEKMEFSNIIPGRSTCYCAPGVQSMGPFLQYPVMPSVSSQKHPASHFNEFCDFQMKHQMTRF
ncbi:hypothetical protein HHK36_030554 [Tetracentron sinense]|uniref:MADS-box domain-containing protein n=1 Tax=Tetracentron sinense TaxID=13715 RepID=A0A834Y7X4_TETSI|nr:hypothetical protein HHK36_030554 [Tetracentron sinense]